MNDLPPPSRRVLDELHAERFISIDAQGRGITPVARAWLALDAALTAHAAALAELDRLAAALVAALTAHAAALAELDRLAAALVAAHGYPRVALPTPAGTIPLYAADAATINRRVADPATARRLKAALRRRQRRFAAATASAGLAHAQAGEAGTARDLSTATPALLLAPATTSADLALKLVVLIAAGEAGPDETAVFPWSQLRAVLADILLESAVDRLDAGSSAAAMSPDT